MRIKAKVKGKNIRNCVHTCARVRMHFGYVKNKPKCHVSKLEHYVCDKGVVKRALEAAAAGYKELGTSMTGKWTELTRK